MDKAEVSSVVVKHLKREKIVGDGTTAQRLHATRHLHVVSNEREHRQQADFACRDLKSRLDELGEKLAMESKSAALARLIVGIETEDILGLVHQESSKRIRSFEPRFRGT